MLTRTSRYILAKRPMSLGRNWASADLLPKTRTWPCTPSAKAPAEDAAFLLHCRRQRRVRDRVDPPKLLRLSSDRDESGPAVQGLGISLGIGLRNTGIDQSFGKTAGLAPVRVSFSRTAARCSSSAMPFSPTFEFEPTPTWSFDPSGLARRLLIQW